MASLKRATRRARMSVGSLQKSPRQTALRLSFSVGLAAGRVLNETAGTTNRGSGFDDVYRIRGRAPLLGRHRGQPRGGCGFSRRCSCAVARTLERTCRSGAEADRTAQSVALRTRTVRTGIQSADQTTGSRAGRAGRREIATHCRQVNEYRRKGPQPGSRETQPL